MKERLEGNDSTSVLHRGLFNRETSITALKIVLGIAIGAAGMQVYNEVVAPRVVLVSEQPNRYPYIIRPEVISVPGSECNDVLVITPAVIQPQDIEKSAVVFIRGACSTPTP